MNCRSSKKDNMAELNGFKSMRIFLIYFALMLGFDQGSKYLAGLLELPVIYNRGISFGLAESSGSLLTIGLVAFTSLALVIGLRQYWFEHQILAGIFFGAVVSNLVDRLIYGAVIDWLAVPFLNLHNNLADIIVVSILVFRVAPDLILKRGKSGGN